MTLLLKGLEEEVYTGNHDGEVVGMSHRIAADLPGFVCEPDCRNAEYATEPIREYDRLACEVLGFRERLRRYLACRGGYTLIPGAALSLGDSTIFYRSDPANPYHSFIEENYGTKVVTASVHINLGLDDPETLIRAYRVLRCEAALFLALSASSPFLDNQMTGYHSTRWQLFPHTPPDVPLFQDHAHYVEWIEAQLAAKTMQNIRHIWAGVRPNGYGAPHEIQRLELRICDRFDDLRMLIATTALLEARVWQIIEDPNLDPLNKRSETELLTWITANEQAVARTSLDAEVQSWVTGATVPARDWIAEMLTEIMPIAQSRGFDAYVGPIAEVLAQGNQTQRWLTEYKQGASIQAIIQKAIHETIKSEESFRNEMKNRCCLS